MSFFQLRPLAFGEVLDAAFSLYRRNFGPFFAAALAAGVPAMALWLVIAALVSSSGVDGEAALMISGGVAFLSLPVLLSLQLLQWGVLTYLSSRSYMGEPETLRPALQRALRRFFPLAGAVAVSSILIGVALVLLFIPAGIMIAVAPFLGAVGVVLAFAAALIFGSMFFAIAPITVVEGRGPVEALGRSRELTSGALARTAGVVLVAVIIAGLPAWGLEAFRRVYFGMNANAQLASDPWTYCILQSVSSLVQALTVPFVVAAIVVQYYDRRVRAEALDVELAAQALGAPAPSGI